MFRRIVAMALLVSFVAMATSGAMMFVIERPSFTMQMHPVHKLFGILMVLSAVAHMTLNFHSITAHIRSRTGIVVAITLSVLLVLLYAVAANNAVPEDLAKEMDAAAASAESRK